MADHSSKDIIYVLSGGVSTDEFIGRITKYKNARNDEDPFCIEHVSQLIRKLELWEDSFGPSIKPHFAIKSQNNPVTRRLFHRLGHGYDCASKVELENVLDTGCKPSQIIYANPYKQISHLPIAFKHNVLTVLDTVEEVDKLNSAYERYKKGKMYTGGKPTTASSNNCTYHDSECNETNGHTNGHTTPNTDYSDLVDDQRQYDLEEIEPLSVLLRIEGAPDTKDEQVRWSLSGKFGCHWDTFEALATYCKKQGTIVKGISFHVGQRVTDADPWTQTIKGARTCWDILLKLGYKPTILNIGGGFAGREEKGMRPIKEIGQKIQDGIKLHFGEFLNEMTLMSEPGTFISACTQSIVAQVISRKVCHQSIPQYYVSTGVYGGLWMYWMDSSNLPDIKPVENGSTQESVKCKLWGSSLDAADILGEAYLPSLEVGDWIQFDELGDYYMELVTTFDGFASPRLVYVCEERDTKQIEQVFGNDKDFKLVYVS